MIRRQLSFVTTCVLAITLALAPTLRAQSPPPPCDSSCSHFYNSGTQFPYLEAISSAGTTIMGSSDPATAQWTPIQTPCNSNGEINSTTQFSVTLRAYFFVSDATVPIGSHFEVKLALTNSLNQEISSSAYTRILQVAPSGGSNPQGEWFNTTLPNIAPGNYRYTLSVRLLATGTITASTRFITAQGSPYIYGGASTVNFNAVTVGGAWVLLGDAPFMNASTSDVDVELGATFSIVSGTSQDQLMLGLGFDNVSSNGHNSIVYVPDSSYLPQSVNAFDHYPNEGVTGTIAANSNHHVQLWAKNLSGHTTTVQYSQIQAIGFPANNGLRGFFASAGPAGVSVDHPAPQPMTCIMLDQEKLPNLNLCSDGTHSAGGGNWTKLGSVSFSPSADSFYVVGDGYVEILGRVDPTDSQWAIGSWAQVGVEAVTGDGKGSDFHMVNFFVPTAATYLYFYVDAELWGNAAGNTINLWIRKVVHSATPPPASGAAPFTVGRSYMGVRFLNVASSCANTAG